MNVTAIQNLTAELARKLLRYEPETGKLFWRERSAEFFTDEWTRMTWNARFSGKQAIMCPDRGGYHAGTILYRTYRAHRVIWLIQTGNWPVAQVDHINGVKTDNRWNNLRDVSASENLRNCRMSRNNTSGVTGVRQSRSGKWIAYIHVNGRDQRIGQFSTIEEAADARSLANAAHGYTARHGLNLAPLATPEIQAASRAIYAQRRDEIRKAVQ
jgi:hypothetical protein